MSAGNRRMLMLSILALFETSKSNTLAKKRRKKHRADQEVTRDIVRGNLGNIRNHPYAVTMMDGDGTLCGGFLVDARSVIGASHCIPLMNIGTTIVHLGQNNLGLDEGIRVSPAYFRVVGEDLAYMRLSETVDTSRYTPLALPDASDAYFMNQGQTLTIMGWGLTESGQNAVFRTANVIVRSNKSAKKMYAKRKTRKGRKKPKSFFRPTFEFAAGGFPQADTCKGDSGGPAIGIRPDGTHVAIGVTSYGSFPCGVKFGIYTKVLVWVTQIRQAMA